MEIAKLVRLQLAILWLAGLADTFSADTELTIQMKHRYTRPMLMQREGLRQGRNNDSSKSAERKPTRKSLENHGGSKTRW